MAGCWASSIFVCLWSERESEKSIFKHAKKEKRLISSHLEGTCLVNKEFIICFNLKDTARDTARNPESAR